MLEILTQYDLLQRKSEKIYHQFAKYSGMSDAAFRIMYSVQEGNGTYIQKDLVENLCITKQTVNSALKLLERENYITLETKKENKREKNIVLTKKGKEFIKDYIIPLMEKEEKAFGRLTDEEQQNLLELSKKQVGFLEKEVNELIEFCDLENKL